MKRREFPEIKNAKKYVEATWKFVDNPPKGTIIKILPNGKQALYHPASNTLVFVKDRLPQSMYRPIAGIKRLSEPKNQGIWGGIIK